MAYEFITEYIARELDSWNRLEERKNKSERWAIIAAKQDQIAYSLGNFYLYFLKGRPKFSAQRKHCAEVLKKINPAFAKGLGIK